MSGVLVLDIETIVDERVWSPPADDPGMFAPPYAHRVICVGCVLLEHDKAANVIKTVRVGVLGDDTGRDGPALVRGQDDAGAEQLELAILRCFAGFVGERKPQVVTWNGRRFDVPVLMLRSMRAGLPQPWFYANREARYRFTEDGHCDLADHMGEFGATQGMHLDGMAKLIGLPGKFGDIDGAGVGRAFAAGRIRDIGSYCLADAAQTAFLALRWWHLKGQMPTEIYRRSVAGLLEACSATGRLDELVRLVDRRVLLLEDAAEAAA